MTVKYLLPCSCGERIAIESSQAGQNIHCSCGKTLEVPTMQGIRRLEQSADTSNESGATASYGGAAAGIALLGLVILAGGGGLIWWTHARQPVLVDVDYMSPWDTWLMWQNLHEGVRMPEYANSPYHEAKKVHDQYMTVGYVIMVAGIVTLVCALAVAVVRGRSKRGKIPQRAP